MVVQIIVAAIGALAAVTAAIITSRAGSRLRAVHDQVANTHPTNLRDDLDTLLDGVGELRIDVAGIREEIRLERRERLALEERVNKLKGPTP